jgi:prophage antirepressor-like protein
MSLPVQPPDEAIRIRRGTDQYGNTVWFFGDHAIRVDESGPEPRFCLKDCLEANGLNGKGGHSFKKLKSHKGTGFFCTLKGQQRLVTISEQGFYILSMRGHKPVSEQFRQWLAEVAARIRKTGTYSVGEPATAAVPATPQTAIQLLQQQAAMALQVITQLADQERRVADIEARVERIEQVELDATRRVLSLPPPSVPAPARTDRHNIVEHVRGFCAMTHVPHAEAFGKLYREVRYRLHLDVAGRRRRDPERYPTGLDVIEEAGLLAQAYALAGELFRWEPRVAE